MAADPITKVLLLKSLKIFKNHIEIHCNKCGCIAKDKISCRGCVILQKNTFICRLFNTGWTIIINNEGKRKPICGACKK